MSDMVSKTPKFDGMHSHHLPIIYRRECMSIIIRVFPGGSCLDLAETMLESEINFTVPITSRWRGVPENAKVRRTKGPHLPGPKAETYAAIEVVPLCGAGLVWGNGAWVFLAQKSLSKVATEARRQQEAPAWALVGHGACLECCTPGDPGSFPISIPGYSQRMGSS